MANDKQTFKPGKYTVSAQGHNGTFSMDVTFSADRIEAINVDQKSETAGISDVVYDRIPDAIVDGQTLNVDAVTGVEPVAVLLTALLKPSQSVLRNGKPVTSTCQRLLKIRPANWRGCDWRRWCRLAVRNRTGSRPQSGLIEKPSIGWQYHRTGAQWTLLIKNGRTTLDRARWKANNAKLTRYECRWHRCWISNFKTHSHRSKLTLQY